MFEVTFYSPIIKAELTSEFETQAEIDFLVSHIGIENLINVTPFKRGVQY